MNRTFMVLRDADTCIPLYFSTFQQAARASRNKHNHTTIFEVWPARLADVQGKMPTFYCGRPSHVIKSNGDYACVEAVGWRKNVRISQGD